MDAIQRALNINRSVNFDCTVTIDQLVNVPLLNGSFRLKWRFSHPINSAHIEAQLKAKNVASSITQRLVTSDEELPMLPPPLPAARFPSHYSKTNSNLYGTPHPGPTDHSPRAPKGSTSPQTRADDSTSKSSKIPRSTSVHNLRNPASEQSAPRRQSVSSSFGRKSFGLTRLPTHLYEPMPTESVVPSRNWNSIAALSQASLSLTPTISYHSNGLDDPYISHPGSPRLGQAKNSNLIELPIKGESSGSTEFVEVKNHTVVFRQAFHCPISIHLDKDGILQPCILNMSIKEQHITDNGRREVSRHGIVDVDLSQFTPLARTPDNSPRGEPSLVDMLNSRIEKAKFLLKECRTNASLKMQIQMDYIGGATTFRSPRSLSEMESEPITRIIGPQDDGKSLPYYRMPSAGSPVSSIISSNSSYRKPGSPSSNQNTSFKSRGQQSSTPNSHPTTPHPHQQELTFQVADDVINLLFSNTYVPSSGPISQRLQSARRKKPPSSSRKDNDGQRLLLPSKQSDWDRNRIARDGEISDEKSSGRSIRSFKTKFNLFNRSTSQLSTLL